MATKIRAFKHNGVSIFGTYQKSGMCTVNGHALDHICGDIRWTCSLFICSADLYEYAHKRWNREFWRTSKILVAAIGNSIHMVEVRIKHNEGLVESIRQRCQKRIM